MSLQKKDSGMDYAPKTPAARLRPVCEASEFPVGVIGLDHGHIYGMCNGLSESGAGIKLVFDPDQSKLTAFLKAFPGTLAARCEEEVLEDHDIRLIASASIPSERCGLGMKAMACGKDYFSDKPPFTTRQQLDQARLKTAETGLNWAIYYSERIHVEASVLAERLIREGAIGRVVQVLNIAPHRISLSLRPTWFFDREKYGGIIVDLGCHQIEQFLYFTGAKDARIDSSRIANYHFKQYPGFSDFGDASLSADNGATGYMRVDWLNPAGLGAWGTGDCLCWAPKVISSYANTSM